VNKTPEVGKPIGSEESVFRDCIHVAVAPVVAGMTLTPGQHVAIDPSDMTAWSSPPIKAMTVGIVDPYLTGPVMKGQRFWLFLYPGTVTGLRHAWSHPAFAPRVTVRPVYPVDPEEV
jgi:hypothetical protein